MKKTAIRMKCVRYQYEIDGMISWLLNQYDKRISDKSFNGYITDTCRGRAHVAEGQFTVPLWAYKRGNDYFTYYVAHEMSHIIAWRKNHNGVAHDKHFYEVFKKLCPISCQKYELGYKKRAGVSYGVYGK